METYDLIIIGAGPSGINVGIEAQKRGKSHLILDKGMLVNSVYHFPTNMTFFSTSRKLEIGQVPFISHGTKPTRREALEYYRRVVEQWALNVHTYEAVKAVAPREDETFEVMTTKTTYRAGAVVVATGFYDKPNLLAVPGEKLPKVKHYYDDPHPYAGKQVVVVGAENSAVDVALETYRAGAAVTMVIREAQIGERVKYWVRPDILNRIEEGSIKALFRSQILEIREESVRLMTPEGEKELANDFVLAMTGYQPDFSLLQKLGIRLADTPDQAPIYDPETLETPQNGLFVAGVVAAGSHTSTLYIENTRHHARLILDAVEKKVAV